MRSGSTRKAATLLGLTQPAVSQSLKRIKLQAALPLFSRSGGRFLSAPEAHALLLEIDRVFIGMDAINHRLASLRNFGVNQLDISCYPAFGLGFMPRVLARFKAIKPSQLAEVSFLALNPEDASRRRLEAAMAEHGVRLRIAAQTPYAACVCELALRGLGVGLVNLITALDYAERGLVVRKFSIDVSFACLLVLPASKVLSTTAREFLSLMRLQLRDDEQKLRTYVK